MTDQRTDPPADDDALGGIVLTKAEINEAEALGIDPEMLRTAKYVELAKTAAKTGWTIAQVRAFGEVAAQRRASGGGVRLADMQKIGRNTYGKKG